MFNYNALLNPLVRRRLARLFRARSISVCVLAGCLLSLFGVFRWSNGTTCFVDVGAGSFLLAVEYAGATGEIPPRGVEIDVAPSEIWLKVVTELYDYDAPGFWINIPFWPFALIALGRLVHGWMSRIPVGLCGQCQYDLTGITSLRCPECGARVRRIRVQND